MRSAGGSHVQYSGRLTSTVTGHRPGHCCMTYMMSTLEEISLRPVDSKDVVDGRHTAPTEPLEQDDATENVQGTSSSSEGTTVQGTTSRWVTVFTTVATLLATSFLNAGISMIAPFYPIVVSCIIDLIEPYASSHKQYLERLPGGIHFRM